MLFGLTYEQWATQSGLDKNSNSINDHALFALAALTSTDLNINDMMFTYLRDTKGLTGALSDMIFAWDGVFGVGGGGPSSGSGLLLESSDFLILETGDYLLLEA